MTTEQRFWIKVKKTKTCWFWTGAQRRSGRFRRGNFWAPNHGRKVTCHRFSWELKNGAIPRDLYVLHKCDNPLCVRPGHLFLGTQADNIADMDRKGRRGTTAGYPGLKGSRNPRAKLTKREVLEIRKMYPASVASQSVLAEMFGVSQTLIGFIVRRNVWSHV